MQMHWQTPTRYMRATLETDLLGDLLIRIVFGGRGNRLGGKKVIPVASEAQAAEVLAKLDKRRIKRGYERVT